MGGTAVSGDAMDGPQFDILDDAYFAHVLGLIERRRCRTLWLGIPCSSFTAMWAWCKCHPFRSRAQPDGRVPTPPEWRSYVDRHNRIVARAAELAIAQHRAGMSFFIENPADMGMMQSPEYRHEARNMVPLWLTSWMRRLVALTEPLWGTTHLCRWFGRFMKPTTVCAAGPLAHAVLALNSVRCYHPAHLMRVTDVDSEGQPLSRAAGEYPPLFAAYFAHWMVIGRPPFVEQLTASPRHAAAFLERCAASRQHSDAPEGTLARLESDGADAGFAGDKSFATRASSTDEVSTPPQAPSQRACARERTGHGALTLAQRSHGPRAACLRLRSSG